MARILITSGPTRQYIDSVRYLSNGSSGRMGAALAASALERGHTVVVISGPVEVEYPPDVELTSVVSTEEMLSAAKLAFERCDGLIGAAAPCDYRPRRIVEHKIAKTGDPLVLELVETDDIVAKLAADKRDRWIVGFALETANHRDRALDKLQRKHCDLIVANGLEAMCSRTNAVEVLDATGEVLAAASGRKELVADAILDAIQRSLIDTPRRVTESKGPSHGSAIS